MAAESRTASVVNRRVDIQHEGGSVRRARKQSYLPQFDLVIAVGLQKGMTATLERNIPWSGESALSGMQKFGHENCEMVRKKPFNPGQNIIYARYFLDDASKFPYNSPNGVLSPLNTWTDRIITSSTPISTHDVP